MYSMKMRPLKFGLMVGIFASMIFSCSTTKVKNSPTKPVYRKIEKPTVQEPIVKEVPKVVEEPKVESKFYEVSLPKVNREFRAAWIATVANINWPSRNNLSTEEQKNEAIRLLDLLQEGNFNAVIFQARPSADALYKSNYEPWSYFLTGETGRSPYPYYDPLEFWVTEAHKRGMELHVWLNPYRAHHSTGGAVNNASMVKQSPDNVVRLKNGMYWFDPASTKTQNHVSEVVRDIVQRYDIDGIHFDDYFYPYASYNGGADFPDNATWRSYQNNGGKLSRADWRRENVNTIIERIYHEIKDVKPYVKFGVSPFGIWKPGYPSGIKGSSQYDELYADAKLWLNKGWIDYFSPQLYWPINSSGQSFPALLNWWQSENTFNRHLWPGLNTVDVKVSDRTSEILNQIQLTEQILHNSVGAVHWSIAGLIKNPSMLQALKNGPYKEKALIPASPWLPSKPMHRPSLEVKNDHQRFRAQWSTVDPSTVNKWILYTRYNDAWNTEILDGSITSKTIEYQKFGQKLNAVAIKAVDRLGNESDYFAERIN